MADGPWTQYAAPAAGTAPPWQAYANPTAAPTAMAVSPSNAPPPGLVPGSKAYAQWAIQQVKAGKKLPQVSKPLPAIQGSQANMTGPLDQISTGFTGAVSNLPIVGPSALSGLEGLKAGMWGVPKAQISAEDDSRAAQNPIANDIGSVAGATLPFIAAGGVPLVGAALGMDGSMPLALQMGLGAASNRAIYAADAAARGQNPSQAGSVAGVVGALSPVLGRGVGAIGQKVADSMTKGSQRAATDAAILANGGPKTVADMKTSAQGPGGFATAYGPNQPMMAVTPDAYDTLMQNVENALVKIRPNAANDPQSVGLLSHLQGLQADAKTPGTVVDLQDLHLARQLAEKVAKSPSGRDSAVGSIVTNQLDRFIQGLQPADILGGGDPTQATKSLFNGISTWARMNRMQIVQDAIDKAQGSASGVEQGLRNNFNGLIRNSTQFAKFTPAEQQAITQVAKGTTAQNTANLFGKLGVTVNNGSIHNIIGMGAGTTGLTAGLYPFLGPAALPAAAAATSAAGYVGRNIASGIANKSAARALQTFATPNIPSVAPMPNMLPSDLFSLLGRFAGGGVLSGQSANAQAGGPSQ